MHKDHLNQAIDKNEGLLDLIRKRDSEIKEQNLRIDELEEDKKEAKRRTHELEVQLKDFVEKNK